KTRTTLKTQTHKGEGSNELRFEDEADKEQIYVHAQKDLDLLTENNRTEVIKNDSHLSVGNDRFTHVKGSRHQTIDGEKRQTIGADCNQTIAGTLHQKSGSATLCEAGSEAHHKAGAKVVLDAGAEITISGSGSFIKLDPSGVTLSGPAIKINSGGAPGSGSGVSPQSSELPQNLDGDTPVSPPAVALAQVGTRQKASADPLHTEELPGGDRKLIVEVIGGNNCGGAVDVIKDSSEGGKA
ncbi:bacteriophage T4 gp5 trimerisation domain-containing protein, partial [Marinobacter aromaticivorans]